MNAKFLGGFLLCIGGCGLVEDASACIPGTARRTALPAVMLDAAPQNSHDNTVPIHDSRTPSEVSHAAGVAGGGSRTHLDQRGGGADRAD